MRLLAAHTLVCSSDQVHPGGGILIRDGRVQSIARSRAAVRRLARDNAVTITELGEGVLAPGTINAHAHLELSALAGRVPFDGSFKRWVVCLLKMRAATSRPVAESALQAATDAALASGTTTIGDIDSCGMSRRLGRHPIRLTLFREVLDGGDKGRSRAAAKAVARALPKRQCMVEGLSPHAPYSISEELTHILARVARMRRLPMAIHWAETEAEGDWMLRGEGDLQGLCQASPRRSGLDHLERAGLLGEATALIHGNHPARGEVARIARSGASLVHCPGSHAFFGRAAFPLERYRKAGVSVALGTDSAASNDGLDMRREMRIFRQRHPKIRPAEVFAMGTANGARALGQATQLGSLRAGSIADLCLYESQSVANEDGLFDALTSAQPGVLATWIAGRCRFQSSELGRTGSSVRPA
ncbi:MAG: cytosine/adenosine deaminase-related metal-dependent hydrolase [Planctomycetota bacterium]|jgi:cytosine/adenosine deaminase-related metal-dependent hydrolase